MTLLRPRLRPTGGDALRALLESERFRLGPHSARVAANLAAHGGLADERAAAWIGDDLPPLGAPSVTLGEARGTLGPRSFGFLDNRRGVAALAAPLPQRPRVGSLALLCGRRDALPDVGPLCVSRDLGVSWILSVGEGDAEPALAWLGADPHTAAVLLAVPSLRPASLAALAGKPAVLLGGDPLLRAAVRHAGGVTTDDLESWLAHGALLESGVPRPRRPAAVAIGAGAALVAESLRAGGLELAVTTIADDDPDETLALLGEADPAADLLLIAGSGPLPRPSRPSLLVDIGHPERLRALGSALALLGKAEEAPLATRPRADGAQARLILDEAGDLLADHDTKRLLKLHGARVSRQAPANSATAALRVGGLLGLPVDVVAARDAGRDPLRQSTRRATTTAELRRAAAVMLDEGVPYVLVREAFPASPRARLSVRRDRALGAYAVVGDERALLPLRATDARLLARAAGRDDEALASLLTACAACAEACRLSLDVDLYTGDEPAVVAAAATRDASA